ncbi:hypothetical protein HII36_00140 [Nonomuraea sp. NN258]|uniref:hypothetical protein n=1 Tax=Nonomuraea antri TaxID=2730852 RepID=UPI00156983CE|nr:hypothetical protein [Nonomuraea antri]NRQ30252.1 hypothetical protein [Nonomuraea antri]
MAALAGAIVLIQPAERPKPSEPKPWRPESQTWTVSYAYDAWPEVADCISCWRLVVRAERPPAGGRPVENTDLYEVAIPDAARYIDSQQRFLQLPLIVSPDGKRIAYFSTAENGYIIRDLATGRVKTMSHEPLTQDEPQLHVSPNGRYFSLTLRGESPRVYFIETGERVGRPVVVDVGPARR